MKIRTNILRLIIAGLVIVIYVCPVLKSQQTIQSSTYGNTFIHEGVEMVVFGTHNFLDGGYGVLPGIVGTSREGDFGFFGFSDLSSGWKGASAFRHVDGYVKIYGSEPFTFPIGDNGRYRPVAISGASETAAAYFRSDPGLAQTSDLFGGELPSLPSGAPFNRESRTELINQINDREYWDIDGDRPTKITLTWDFYSDIGNLTQYDIQKLSIVGWNGQEWESIPSQVDILYLSLNESTPYYFGGLSTLINGSITTTEDIIPNDYYAYTLASLSLAIVGDFVWEDSNRNGIQDDGETGLSGVQVQLLNENDDIIRETTTNSNGNYHFIHISPGTYSLRFVTPLDYSITLPGQGDILKNSDVTFETNTIPFILYGNETDLSIDAGYYKTGSIGDFVWIDSNGDGIQDAGEPGMENIRVELLNSNQEVLASTLTNEIGFYAFTNLPPVEYFLRFQSPVGYDFSPYHSIADRSRDSDVHPETGITDRVGLTSGLNITKIDVGLSSPCGYVASLEIGPSVCGQSIGYAEVTVEGSTGPFSFHWNTGETTAIIESLNAGSYLLTVTDANQCNLVIDVIVENEEECELVCVDLKTAVFLEGPFDYDILAMRPELNELGYLPGQKPVTFFGKYTEPGQPFNFDPWFYGGTEGKNYSSTAKDNNNEHYPVETVDWVLVSLRSEIQNEYETCTRAGLLMTDGTIEFMDEGCCLVDPAKSYYIVIEHRNHLIVMSPEAIPIEDSSLSYDFRLQESYRKLLGYGQKEIAPNIFAMYTANGDQYVSSQSPFDINVNDMTEWLKENGSHSSYYRMDFDLNGDANVQDKGLYLENIGVFTDVPKN